MDDYSYRLTHTGAEVDEAVGKALGFQFMTEPTSTNKIATAADLPSMPTVPTIASSGMLKGDGNGNAVAATAGTDYQAAITASGMLKGDGAGGVSAAVAGTDYQAPLSFYSTPTAQNTVTTEAEMGTRLQSYTSGTSTTWSGTVNCGQAMVANPATGRTSVSITLGTAKATTQTSEWYAAFKAGSGCSVTVTPPSGKTLKWKDGVPTWTANHFYELSFVMAGSYIIVAVLDTDLS